jgi:hypothetical protein
MRIKGQKEDSLLERGLRGEGGLRAREWIKNGRED